MKTTGIVRRMDDMGRIVIPRTLRQMYHIKEDQLFEFYNDDGNLIIKKYDDTAKINWLINYFNELSTEEKTKFLTEILLLDK